MLEKKSMWESGNCFSPLCVLGDLCWTMDTICEKNKFTRATFGQLLTAKLKPSSPQNRFDIAQEEEVGG